MPQVALAACRAARPPRALHPTPRRLEPGSMAWMALQWEIGLYNVVPQRYLSWFISPITRGYGGYIYTY